jgi:hypothetical protein
MCGPLFFGYYSNMAPNLLPVQKHLMRKTSLSAVIVTLSLSTAFFCSHAQSTVDQVSNTTDKVNNTIDKVGGLFKKKKKNKTDSTATAKPASSNTNITINSVYDFVPGNNVLFVDHFDSTVAGNFPAKWTTDASGEVVTLQQYPGNWFSTTNNGTYIPKIKGGLPKDFSIEFDLIIANSNNSHTLFVDLEDALNGNFSRFPSNPYLQFRIYNGGMAYVECKGKNLNTNVTSSAFNEGGKINHFAFRKQGERLLIYINQEKTFDINHAFEGDRTYSTFKFGADFFSPAHFLVSNVKIAGI